MSPRWASVGSMNLYFYGSEPHRRPDVGVRGPGSNATVDVETGEALAGYLPPKQLRQVRRLLEEHRELAIEAFERAFQHDFPGTLEQQLEDRE